MRNILNTNPTPKRRKPVPAAAPNHDHRGILARLLDRQADAELSMGHHLAAERLAWRAATLRETAP